MTVFGSRVLTELSANEAIRVALIQADWCPYKRGQLGHTGDTRDAHSQTDNPVKTQQEAREATEETKCSDTLILASQPPEL